MMTTPTSSSVRSLTRLIVIAMASGAGCGTSAQSYVTPPSTARESLETALRAWEGGKAPDALATGTPPIHVVDARWQGGAKLTGFEIVSESPGEGPRQFEVKLSLAEGADQATSVEDKYLVVGREPVWVYRQQDYDRAMNMDNNPENPNANPGR